MFSRAFLLICLLVVEETIGSEISLLNKKVNNEKFRYNRDNKEIFLAEINNYTNEYLAKENILVLSAPITVSMIENNRNNNNNSDDTDFDETIAADVQQLKRKRRNLNELIWQTINNNSSNNRDTDNIIVNSPAIQITMTNHSDIKNKVKRDLLNVFKQNKSGEIDDENMRNIFDPCCKNIGKASGRKHHETFAYMLVPWMMALGYAPLVLSGLKMLVWKALLINQLALSVAIFITIRNMLFGPRPGGNVKYINYSYLNKEKPAKPNHDAFPYWFQ